MIGVYGGFIDKFPAGAWMNRSLTLRTGQCHVQRYMRPLLQRIERGEIDPTRIITHTLPLDEAERGYEIFKNKQDDCEKVVLRRVHGDVVGARSDRRRQPIRGFARLGD